MSLTGELRSASSLTRNFFDEHLPHVKQLSKELNKSLKFLGLTEDKSFETAFMYSISGAAIDYRIRAYLSDEFYRGEAIRRGIHEVESSFGVSFDEGPLPNPWREHLLQTKRRPPLTPISEIMLDAIEDFVERARPTNNYLDDDKERRLCEICILLASFDFSGRANWSSKTYLWSIGTHDFEEMVSRLNSDIVNDVMRISRLFYTANAGFINGCRHVACGTTFAGSNDIGGADCDLIVDGTLIDVKSLKTAKISLEYILQLLGYLLLDYDDEMKIRETAIYFSRQAHWCKISLSELLGGNDLRTLRGEFKSRMRKLANDRRELLAKVIAARDIN